MYVCLYLCGRALCVCVCVVSFIFKINYVDLKPKSAVKSRREKLFGGTTLRTIFVYN